MVCPNCGAENPGDSRFCNQCGSLLNRTCAACGKPLAENARFCNYCGAPVRASAAAQVNVRSAAPTSGRKGAAGVLGIVGSGCAMLGALLALIFVFLIGTAVTGSAEELSGIPVSIAANSLYDYFGDAYRTIEALLEQASVYPGYYPTALYVSVVFGTIAAAAALASTVVLFLLALIRFVRNLCKKTDKRADGLALAAFLSYLACTMLFLSAERIFLSVDTQISSGQIGGIADVSVNAQTALNSTTVAGICTGAVCLFAWLVCTVTAGILKNGLRTALVRRILSIAAAAFCIAVLCILTAGTVQFGMNESESVYLTYSLLITAGFAPALTMTGSIVGGLGLASVPDELVPVTGRIMGLTIAGFAAQLIFTGAFIWLLCRLFCTAADGRKRGLLLPGILTAAAAMLAGILGAVTANAMTELLELASSGYGDALESNVTNAVLACVFAGAALIVLIVQKALGMRPAADVPAVETPFPAPGSVREQKEAGNSEQESAPETKQNDPQP